MSRGPLQNSDGGASSSPDINLVQRLIAEGGRVRFIDLHRRLGTDWYQPRHTLYTMLDELKRLGSAAPGGRVVGEWDWIVSCQTPSDFHVEQRIVFERLRARLPEGWVWPNQAACTIGIAIPSRLELFIPDAGATSRDRTPCAALWDEFEAIQCAFELEFITHRLEPGFAFIVEVAVSGRLESG